MVIVRIYTGHGGAGIRTSGLLVSALFTLVWCHGLQLIYSHGQWNKTGWYLTIQLHQLVGDRMSLWPAAHSLNAKDKLTDACNTSSSRCVPKSAFQR